MELYDWQKECLEKWYQNNTRGIVNVFTGAGKTILALAAAGSLRETYAGSLQVRIVVPTIALAKQWKKELISFFPEIEFDSSAIGFFYGAIKNNPFRDFMIYVINSAREVLPHHVLYDMKKGIHTFLICDECHRYTGEVNRNVFRFIDSKAFDPSLYHCMGLSATPQNENFETVLVPALGPEIYRYDIHRAREEERISKFVLFHTAISLNGMEAAEYGELSEKMARLYGRLLECYPHLKYADSQEFYQFVFRTAREDPDDICFAFVSLVLNRRNLIYSAENRKKCVLSILSRIRNDEKVILFAERIDQADQIYRDLLPVYGNLVTHYHSEMPAELRAHNLSLFRIGEARILVSCKALDEGLDVPDASIGIVVSATSVNRQRIQRLGRILRKNPGKDMAVLYYIYTRGTSESGIYLDDLSGVTDEIDVSYDGHDDLFYSDMYSQCASRMYKQLPADLSTKQKREINACLEEGVIRPDWFLSPALISRYIDESSSRKEKNYWIVMKRMSETRCRLSAAEETEN